MEDDYTETGARRLSKYGEVNDPEFKIKDTPENILKSILRKPPKTWGYRNTSRKPSS